MIEAAIVSLLEGDAAVAAMVGTRIYPAAIPQGEPAPSIAYWRVSTGRRLRYDAPDGTSSARYQLDMQASDYTAARALAAAVRHALNGYRGSVAGEQIHHISLPNEQDIFDRDVGAHRVALDVIIAHEE